MADLGAAERFGPGFEQGGLLGGDGAVGLHAIDIGGALGQADHRRILLCGHADFGREQPLAMDPSATPGDQEQDAEGAKAGDRPIEQGLAALQAGRMRTLHEAEASGLSGPCQGKPGLAEKPISIAN